MWACHWLLASVVKQAVDEWKHLAYHQAHHQSTQVQFAEDGVNAERRINTLCAWARF